MGAPTVRVLLLNQAPGLGGGDRLAVSALRRAPDLEVVVAAHPPVCSFAADLGLTTERLELRRAHRLTHGPRILRGGLRVARLAQAHHCDALFASGTRAFPYAVAARLLGGPPVVAHHVGVLTGGPIRSLVWGLERWTDAIIVPSHASAAPFSRDGKVRVLPNAIDLDRFRPPEDRATAKSLLGLPPDQPVVGTVGRADPGKGMADFLRVAERLAATVPAVRFLLAGGATFPHERPHYEAIRAAASRLEDRIRLLGPLKDPLPAFHATDVFVHLGKPEGAPIVALEAMACGIPVVAYRWGGIAELVVDGETGTLVDPGSEEGASRAIERYLEEASHRRRAGEQGRALCERRHELGQFAVTLTRILVEAAGASS